MAYWLIRSSDFKFSVMHRAGTRGRAADALSRVNTGRIGTFDLRDKDDGPEMMLPFVKQRGGKITYDRDGDSDLSCICKQCDDIVK